MKVINSSYLFLMIDILIFICYFYIINNYPNTDANAMKNLSIYKFKFGGSFIFLILQIVCYLHQEILGYIFSYVFALLQFILILTENINMRVEEKENVFITTEKTFIEFIKYVSISIFIIAIVFELIVKLIELISAICISFTNLFNKNQIINTPVVFIR